MARDALRAGPCPEVINLCKVSQMLVLLPDTMSYIINTDPNQANTL